MRFHEAVASISEDVTEATARRLLYQAKRWRENSGDPHLEHVTSTIFDAFRQSCLRNGYSVWSIEPTITDVITTARRAVGVTLEPGRRLRKPPPRPRPPSHGAIARLYLAADRATWPRRDWCEPGDWWRALLTVALWTGFRRGDLRDLTWDEIDAEEMVIRTDANKTGRRHDLPLMSTVQRHLMAIYQPDRDLVFGFPTSTNFSSFRIQFRKLAATAKVKPVTLKQLRQASITMWSSVNAEAGRIVHGCHLGVLSHYIDPLQILRATAPMVQLPEVILTDEERESDSRHRQELLDLYARAGTRQRKLILDVARQMA